MTLRWKYAACIAAMIGFMWKCYLAKRKCLIFDTSTFQSKRKSAFFADDTRSFPIKIPDIKRTTIITQSCACKKILAEYNNHCAYHILSMIRLRGETTVTRHADQTDLFPYSLLPSAILIIPKGINDPIPFDNAQTPFKRPTLLLFFQFFVGDQLEWEQNSFFDVKTERKEYNLFADAHPNDAAWIEK